MPSSEAIIEGSPLEPPFSQYEELRHEKFTVDFFKLPDVFKMPENPLDRYNLRGNIIELEKWVGEQIEAQGLPDSLDSYRMVVNKMLQDIGDTPHETAAEKMFRVGNYVKYLRELASAARLKPLFSR